MQQSDIPSKIPVPFASGADPSLVEVIPQTASPTPGKASFTTGFTLPNFEQIAAGGIPPYGKDMNGILLAVTEWLRWTQAGGPIKWDTAFCTTIGGYPKYALVLSATPGSYGKMWLSIVENNMVDPDSVGQTSWVPYPDVLIQLQANNYAADAGVANQVTIVLGRAPASWAEIVGAPIRFKAAAANSTNNPTIRINGLTPATIVNPDGGVLGIGQYTIGTICEGIPRDDGTFQLNTPGKQYSPSGTFPIPGFVMPWPNETAPSGFVECNGETLLISSYPNLWAVLGTRYGGDGVTNFKLPDYRGEFLRGWDHGRGLDPNAATRTNAGGGITGDHVGTNQAGAAKGSDLNGAFISILNPYTKEIQDGDAFDRWLATPNPAISEVVNAVQGQAFVSTTPNLKDGYSLNGIVTLTGGGLETRPVNINVMWVIFTG